MTRGMTHPCASLRAHARSALTSVLVLAILLSAGSLAAACGGSSDAAADSGGGSPGTLTVFAAASLTDAFTQLGENYEAAHPGVRVTLSFAGSQDLVAQLQQAAPADVLATADTASMDDVADLVGDPTVFARNQLAIAVEPGNPRGISSLADLAKPGLKVVLAAPEVPAGRYARQVLDNAGVEIDPVSLEESVKGVVTKVSLGEADAGIVYVSDVTAARGAIDGIDIPDSVNVVADYPLATVAESDAPEEAQAFVDLVLSLEGQETLASFGFLAPERP